MFKTLRTKMIVLFSGIFAIMLISLSGFLYINQKNSIEESVKNSSVSLSNELQQYVGMFLEKYSSNIKMYSVSQPIHDYLILLNSKSQGERSRNQLKSEFSDYLDSNASVSNVYVASKTGSLLLEPYVELPKDFNATDREWYKMAISSPDQVVWSPPYKDAATGKFIVTASKTVMDPNTKQIIGVVGLDLKIDKLTELIASSKIGYGGFAFLFDPKGVAMVHPTEQGKDLSNYSFVKEMYNGKSGEIKYNFQNNDRILFYTTTPNGWKIGIAYKYNEMLQDANNLGKLLAIVTAFALVLISVIIYFITLSITKPIMRLKEQASKIAEGDLTVNIESHTKDEVGQLTDHFAIMLRNLRELISSVQISANHVQDSAGSLSAISEETTASSEEITRAMEEISNGTSQAAIDAETSNQRTHELSSQIESVNRQTGQLLDLSKESTTVSEQGHHQMQMLQEKTVESRAVIDSVEQVVKDLAVKIKDIEKIILAINDISDQTNLLALNASIEAARAGEHGKGFAVVADEVRKLAEQSRNATDEVRQTIEGIQHESNRAIHQMKETKIIAEQQGEVVYDTEKAFESISTIINNMISAINGITKDISEIAIHKEEVVSAIQNISATLQQTAAGSEEVNASAEQQLIAIKNIAESAEMLNDASIELIELVKKFKM